MNCARPSLREAKTEKSSVSFWNGFYEYCSTRPGFGEAFNDPADRLDNPASWADFGINRFDCHLVTLVWKQEQMVGVKIYWRDIENYRAFSKRRGEIDARLGALGGEILWDAEDAPKKSRSLTVRRPADWGDLSALYEWMVAAMFALRAIVLASS